eukprot:7509201-Alexandrium_andersonii.AAC.1
MVRASSSHRLGRIHLASPLDFANWREAYTEAHDSSLANNRIVRIEMWKLSWSMVSRVARRKERVARREERVARRTEPETARGKADGARGKAERA